MRPDFDVIIVGAGMAGMTAALWAKRLGLSTMVLESEGEPGGQLRGIQDKLVDYPGFTGTGPNLAQTLYDQLARLDIQAKFKTTVQPLNSNESESSNVDGALERSLPAAIQVTTSQGSLSGRSVLITTGLRRRRLAALDLLPADYLYYTSQPRAAFTGNRLLILGGGDGAVENAILLSSQWKEIVILHRSGSLKARPSMLAGLNQLPNVRVILNATVQAINRPVISIMEGPEKREIQADRILVKIGFEADNALVTGNEYVPGQFVQTSGEQQVLGGADSRVWPGIWAAGDICSPRDPSLVVAAGQACLAVRSIERHLRMPGTHAGTS
ncbi:MAG: NAD(P)/FAD-dependent oxidoreductase [Spirochaetia bacterium]|nr:NAD(P)/FAD-dependent oxidoreductase [Spirochaetia bacterium]